VRSKRVNDEQNVKGGTDYAQMTGRENAELEKNASDTSASETGTHKKLRQHT